MVSVASTSLEIRVGVASTSRMTACLHVDEVVEAVPEHHLVTPPRRPGGARIARRHRLGLLHGVDRRVLAFQRDQVLLDQAGGWPAARPSNPPRIPRSSGNGWRSLRSPRHRPQYPRRQPVPPSCSRRLPLQRPCAEYRSRESGRDGLPRKSNGEEQRTICRSPSAFPLTAEGIRDCRGRRDLTLRQHFDKRCREFSPKFFD